MAETSTPTLPAAEATEVRRRTVLNEARDQKIFLAGFLVTLASAELLLFFYGLLRGEVLPGEERVGPVFAVSMALELGLVLLAFILPVFMVPGRFSLAVSALGLAPLFRVMNVATPAMESVLWFVSVSYLLLLMAIGVFLFVERAAWTPKSLGLTVEGLGVYVPAAVGLAFVLAVIEFGILGHQQWIPSLTAPNLFYLSVSMIFFVGLGEELMFRGLIQTRLERLFGLRAGLLFTSLVFGVMHGVWNNGLELVFTFSVGLMFGYLFQRTRSLPFVAVLHGTEDIFLFGLLPFWWG